MQVHVFIEAAGSLNAVEPASASMACPTGGCFVLREQHRGSGDVLVQQLDRWVDALRSPWGPPGHHLPTLCTA